MLSGPEDVAAARLDSPVRLRFVGAVAAGEKFSEEVSAGTCVRLFTGSPLPAGADAVVMQEDTKLDAATPNQVLIFDSVKPCETLHFRGEDVKRGAPLVAKGDSVTVGRLALLAATGCAEVLVSHRPVVGIIATGSELREPGQSLTQARSMNATVRRSRRWFARRQQFPAFICSLLTCWKRLDWRCPLL